MGDSQTTVFMTASISLDNFSPKRLTCFTETIKKRYPSRKDITVLIFSSYDAAERYTPNPPDYAPAKNPREQTLQSPTFWRSQLHGFYSYSADKQEEYLDIRPFGSDAEGGPYDTRIDLPTEQLPSCKLQVAGRCLLAIEAPTYPDVALTQGVSARVTFSGLISSKGRIVGVAPAETQATPSGNEKLLIAEAARNLASWRFETASERTPIRITYAYVVDPSLPIPEPYHQQVDVRFELPNVVIRGRKLK